MHFTIAEGFVKATTVGQMGWFFLMAVMYITGAGLYAARIPERFFPGKFDIWVSVGVNRLSGGSSGVRGGGTEGLEAGSVQLCLSTCWQPDLEQVLCVGRAKYRVEIAVGCKSGEQSTEDSPGAAKQKRC